MGESMTHLVRKPDAGKPPVRFDERGVETESTAGSSGTGNRKGRSQLWLRLPSTAPLLDSTNLGRKAMFSINTVDGCLGDLFQMKLAMRGRHTA